MLPPLKAVTAVPSAARSISNEPLWPDLEPLGSDSLWIYIITVDIYHEEKCPFPNWNSARTGHLIRFPLPSRCSVRTEYIENTCGISPQLTGDLGCVHRTPCAPVLHGQCQHGSGAAGRVFFK